MKRKVWFMKKNIIVFFTSVILCGCASNKDVSTSDKFIPEQETISDYNSEEMSNMNTFDNGIISSQCDSSLLQENNVNTDVLSGVAYIKYGADTSEAILNGSCVYAASTQQDSADLFSSAGAEMTKALFDGIFNIQENECSSTYASGNVQNYSLSRQGVICKGKATAINDNTIAFAVYLVLENEDDAYVSAFTNCYESISFLTTQESDLDQKLNDIEKKAEETSASASEITSGKLYDLVSSIYSNFTLVDMDTSLAVNIYFTSTNSDTDNSTLFFNTIKQIINSCEIEKSYSGVIFNMFVDTKMTASITLTSYISPESFSSSYVVIDNNYTDAISDAYSLVFNDYDIQTQFDQRLNSISID